jgi:uncharacterized RDD family membrane protein YckC
MPDDLIPVSLGARLGGVALDCFFVAGITLPLSVMMSEGREPSVSILKIVGVLAIGLLLVNIGLCLHNGNSFGKRQLGLQVVDLDGKPLTLGRRLFRTFLVMVSILLTAMAVSGLDLLCIVFRREDRRSLHDLIAGTKVMAVAPAFAGSGDAVLKLDAQGSLVDIPTGWQPVSKAPRLTTYELLGTTMTSGAPVEPTGKILCGTQVFLLGFPLIGLRRYLYTDLGGEKYRFHAEAPVTRAWTIWNLAVGVAAPIVLLSMVLLGKFG